MLPKNKQYTMSIEFRDAGWRTMFRYAGKQTETFCSYSLHEDTIKVFESGKNYIIQELTDSTLAFQYLPESLTIGNGPVKCVTDNSIQGQRKNEARLDSIWCKENGWNLGVVPINNTDTIGEPPRWASWDYDLEKYFVSRMKYPERLLKENRAGYSVVMFSLDTLGFPRDINILTTKHKDFDKEVVRLVKELPHCLPCRDKYGKRMECFCTVYVPFLPQHYRDRIKDSIAEEELKQCFVEWETMSHFQDGNLNTVTDYINERLTYDHKLLGDKKETKGIYTVRIDSYGEITRVETLRSCGIPEWDKQVLQIIKGMPRWTPTVNHRGKGEYRSSIWTVPVVFRNEGLSTSDKCQRTTYNYDWLIETLSKSCKYPIKLQEKNQEGILHVSYEVSKDGYIINPTIGYCSNRKFKDATLNAFETVTDRVTALPTGKDTLQFQFKLDIPTTIIHPRTDVLIIGFSTCDQPVLMRYDATLIAYTTEPHLEAGVPVCYLNERGDTVVPYGKYLFCQTDTIRKTGFVYENKPKNAKIVCIDNTGKELFYVFKYDNGPDYVQEGLFRIMDEEGLIGFADSTGNIVIEPQYKFAHQFKDGRAKVTLKGERKEVPGKNGENHHWVSEEWFYIDKKNIRLTD